MTLVRDRVGFPPVSIFQCNVCQRKVETKGALPENWIALDTWRGDENTVTHTCDRHGGKPEPRSRVRSLTVAALVLVTIALTSLAWRFLL